MADQYGNYTPYDMRRKENNAADPYLDQMDALQASSGFATHSAQSGEGEPFISGSGFDTFGGSGNAFGNAASTVGAVSQSGVSNVKFASILAKAYILMILALAVTAVAAYTVPPSVGMKMFGSGFYGFMGLFVVEMILVQLGNWAISKNNAIVAGILYTAYAYITGILFSVIFWRLEDPQVVQVTFGCASLLFAVMAVVGITTKKDLTGMGSVLIFGLIGILIVSAINLFFGFGVADIMISVVGVVIFMGLIAYDSQRLRTMCGSAVEANELSLALFCAFQLYLDFINLFLKLLRLFGNRKR